MLKFWIRSFLSGVGFLTPFPISDTILADREALRKSPILFPVIGALLGGFSSGIAWLLLFILPLPVVAAVLVVLFGLLSGALHLDGWADTCDGFLSSRPRARILEIMKDSRTGAMGVFGMSALLLLKFSALRSMPQNVLMTAAFFSPFYGRAMLFTQWALLPAVKPKTSLADMFDTKLIKIALWPGLMFVLLTSIGFAGFKIALVLASGILFILLFNKFCMKKIGGYTGDTLGAVIELSELYCLLAFAAIL